MNRPDKYRYPAVLGYDEPTKQYYVLWPDLPGCTTTGDTDNEAMENAKEAMSLHLWGMEDDGDVIPNPTPIQQLDLNEYEEDGNKFVVVVVEAWMLSFREKMETKAVNRTVTLPNWLDKEAKTASLNYSQILQDGLMERLGISRTTHIKSKGRVTA